MQATTVSWEAPGLWNQYMAPTPVTDAALLSVRNEQAFEQVFKTHFKSLHSYACAILKDEAVAEGVVQNVFLKLWEKADTLQYQQSVTGYLYRSVHNMALNHLKHQKVKQAYDAYAAQQSVHQHDAANRQLHLKELQYHFTEAMNELPEQCRTIFQMSRFREMKYQEIADELGISVKTVEGQMSKALRVLRIKLADFLPILLFTLLK
ncbi:MAG TPA: RNA polymerase sigma-70 factor [Phnomibacter sp.]|nr:RNA polymerase sigma-70 factor [Phnomibacter sp.]